MQQYIDFAKKYKMSIEQSPLTSRPDSDFGTNSVHFNYQVFIDCKV